ncbi:MAG: zf-HC2 domain-containing protein [Phycisphaerae bacterium]|nr:zf-HC2 domain-containing protein [Phycisphaerae bacterium]
MDDKDNISEQLSAYLDGELSDAEARRVEAALRDDPALARELEALRATRQLVRSLPAAKAPEGFTAAVMDRAERLQLVAPTPRPSRWRLHWASLATAALVLVAVGIGAVVTVTVTLMPSWSDKVAHRDEAKRLAVAREKAAEEKGAEPAGAPLMADSGKPAETGPAVQIAAEPRLAGAAEAGRLNAIEGSAEVSPGLTASAERPGDQVGMLNAPVYIRREKSGSLPGPADQMRQAPGTSAPARDVDQIGVMPALAAAPGPRGDRPPGVVTQVGEPLYRVPSEREGAAPSTQAAALPGPAGTVGYLKTLLEAEPSGAAGAPVPRGSLRPLGIERGTVLAADATPAGLPTTQPTSAPSSQATSQPASQPTSQPTSAPASGPGGQ